MNQPENINSLLNILASPIADDNRLLEATQYLRMAGEKRAIGLLYKRLSEKNDPPWTRVEMISATVSIVLANHLNLPQLNSFFVLLLANKSESDEVKEAVIVALGTLGDKQVVDPLISLINRAVNNENTDLVITCVNALKQLKDAKSVPILVRLLSSKEEVISKLSAETLGEFGQDAFPALPRLTDLETSYRGSERQAAHEAILKIKKSITSGIR